MTLDALAPLRLPADLRLSPEQFTAVCIANPQAVLELSAEGHLIHMTPTGGETGARNSRLLMRLLAWTDRVGVWSAGRTSPRSSAAVSRPSAPICWSNSPAPATPAPVASPPCAARWPPTRPMAPNWAGC